MDTYIDRHIERFRGELESFLEIPSVSTDPDRAGDVRRCASWLADRLRDGGANEATLVPTAGHPIVLAQYVASGDAPTVLVYGHYDVQPSSPDDLWTSPPFRPTVRGERIYARGAADDKGQVHMHLKALEAVLATTGRVPLNVTLLIEGEEEVGSPSLAKFVAENRRRLACDAVLISDTTMLAPEAPAITIGTRGLVYAQVTVRGPRRDLHSGHYGGAVSNPANALGSIIGGLLDAGGRITVPRFYDRVRAVTRREAESLRRMPPAEASVQAQTGVPAAGGEAGIDALERIWFRPALDVNGMQSGFTGEGAKTIIPAEATAKISMRLVADQDPDDVAQAFTDHVRGLAPAGVTVEAHVLQRARPWSAEPDHPTFRVAEAALAGAFGTAPVYTRVGGSIPIVPQLAEALGVPILLLGFNLPDGNIHAPDESLHLGVYQRGIRALAHVYRGLAAALYRSR